ncbi:MAG: NAD(P)-dependent oxidoreductase [Candidatus Hydrogenedentales bacterium]
MNILVTGGFGNVGRSAVMACLAAGHSVAIFESPSALKKAGAGFRRLLNTQWASCKFVFGDIRSQADIGRAFSAFPDGPDAVIHLAALIPPAAEKDPEKTKAINIGGTANIIEACRSAPNHPRLVFASSIAIYGDRLKNFWIKTSDEIHPSDLYSETKAECERLLRASGLDFAVLRLSYVVWAKWLPFDPLLFSMPPETRLEIIHTEDAGRAFAAAASHPSIGGQTLDIGGGSLCRTFFRAFLDRVFRYFGLGDSTFLSESAFAAANFHCGWYEDSDYADSLLHFRRKTLEDYYEEVRWETRFLSRLVFIVSPIVKLWLARKSPFSPPPRQRRQANRSGRQLWKESLQVRK